MAIEGNVFDGSQRCRFRWSLRDAPLHTPLVFDSMTQSLKVPGLAIVMVYACRLVSWVQLGQKLSSLKDKVSSKVRDSRTFSRSFSDGDTSDGGGSANKPPSVYSDSDSGGSRASATAKLAGTELQDASSFQSDRSCPARSHACRVCE